MMTDSSRDLPGYHWTIYDWIEMQMEFKEVNDNPKLSFRGPDDSIVIDEYQCLSEAPNNKEFIDKLKRELEEGEQQ